LVSLKVRLYDSHNLLDEVHMYINYTSDPGIPTLDGLTDQNIERSSRPLVRSIGDARARSQYASNRRFRDNGMQIDRETREMAERMGASVTAYREILPQDNKTVTSKELREAN
jgi:hypothetical protein